MRAIRRFTVRPVLPPALEALGELAGNLRWSWHPPTQDLFESIDPELWEKSRHDPVKMLGLVPNDLLSTLAGDKKFLKRLKAARADLTDYLNGPRWYQGLEEGASAPGRSVAVIGIRSCWRAATSSASVAGPRPGGLGEHTSTPATPSSASQAQ